MKTQAELKAIARFVAEYATRLMGSGVHTSRVVRNTKRLGEALGVRVIVSAFQKVVNFSVVDDESGEVCTEAADIPPLPISFELNAELSALSWEAYDEHLPLGEIERRYREIVAQPRLDPIFTLVLVGLANASFCRLFGGDWFAVSIVFTATLIGFFLKQGMQARGFNHYVIFIASAFVASMYASVALTFDTTSDVAIATSVLFLIPGVPLINGVIDIVEGHILNGIARLTSALMLIVCIAVGLSGTLMIVKSALL
ncbi:threonine/serine exporter family protein [uncultured Alistipes sp.]|uniref:threonine/serine exporter family protein n=1 Tax=uncultured Alistipes sp. TaxID=538949 RepID=UPI002589F42C|nr:threonine/serine exporter family protein [uncultured Alistipes sp.]